MSIWTPLVQGVFLIVDVFCIGSSYLLYREQKEVLQNLQNAVKLDVDKNLEGSLSRYPSNQIDYAGIRGRIIFETKEPIPIMEELIESVRKYGRYVLRNPYETPSDLDSNVRFPLMLHSLEHKNVPFKVFVDSVSWGDKHVFRSNAFRNGGPTFYGMSGKNFSRSEDLIVTVFGKVSKVGPGEIRIQYTGEDTAPLIFSRSTTEELIAAQEEYVNVTRVMFGVFGFLGLIILGNFVYSEWKKYTNHRKRLEIFEDLLPAINVKEAKSTQSEINSNIFPISADDSHTLCVACKSSERNTIFSSCKHVCLCQQCAEKSNGICPICSQVSEIHPAYIS